MFRTGDFNIAFSVTSDVLLFFPVLVDCRLTVGSVATGYRQ